MSEASPQQDLFRTRQPFELSEKLVARVADAELAGEPVS